ncbi:hypothetical protein [Cupriavidus sp. TMH.W2]|uniref:hypothetical protein n=1 Tax=Cupriavidus sp. TMH.W2 TaxID=3434465 RepID=UPI003D775F8E
MSNPENETAVFLSLLSEAARTGAHLGPLLHAQKARLQAAGLSDGEINHLIHDRHVRAAYVPRIARRDTPLHVPLADVEQARAMGARRSASGTRWEAPAGSDLNRFLRWLAPG